LPPPFIEAIGYAAATISTLCWFPQSIRTLRTRDTSGVSLVSQSAFTVGIVMWAAYGLLIQSLPIILCNTIQLIPLVAILWIKIGNELAARRAIP